MTAAPEPGAPLALRERAEGLAAPLPALLAAARHLAAAVQTGGHGRRRPGPGAEFWQYRVALAGDEARRIDWRRSARSDLAFVREQEWQAVQTVQIWADGAASMAYRSSPGVETKAGRARLLALAAAILLERGGERVGLADGSLAPRTGPAQVARLADALLRPAAPEDYAAPRVQALAGGARALFLSDFLAGWEGIERTVLAATDRGVAGVLMQVLDPAEEDFPFAGRAIFESMGGSLRHETKEAAGLRARYRERFAARRDQLQGLARLTGWTFGTHRTDHGAQGALLWLHQALGPRR